VYETQAWPGALTIYEVPLQAAESFHQQLISG
jgi:hypothetical protein